MGAKLPRGAELRDGGENLGGAALCSVEILPLDRSLAQTTKTPLNDYKPDWKGSLGKSKKGGQDEKGQTMKTATVLASVHLAACSFGVDVPTLPPSEFADTEASTNFAFPVGAVANRKLVFSLELLSSATNTVEVAIARRTVRPRVML